MKDIKKKKLHYPRLDKLKELDKKAKKMDLLVE